jgi:hypothetical protein
VHCKQLIAEVESFHYLLISAMIALCNLFQLLSALTTLSNSDAFLFNSRYQQKPGHSVAHIRHKSPFDNLLHSSNSEVENVPVTLPETDESQLWKPDSTPHDFDISLAVILAGYSFEAYNEPVRSSKLC